ncbi:hypothetical protein A1O3_01936 [Capronia epimyces CBS 606.96]|uniref:Mid2 domain-containing protein n=1 Tax=Capronia epimyces CBS 606.96 TaxID=1182542 RepID=W9Y7S1_9EURO|nr:uncharacterized protein A1O3_01936 [Capronia epimyces CBS 606.96]EXJ88872.1 hypothetical protein A1O3_01936 [Capronia epimyces CBS 606.96]
MGTSSPATAFGALLIVIARVCNALPSVPIATDPILSTATVSTVVPSLVTIYSVVPATGASDAVQTITTTVNGQETVLTTSDGAVAGSVTSTIISTIFLTTDQVIVNTVGFSTILGPDPSVATTGPAATTAPTTAETASVTTPATTILTPEESSSTSFAAVVASSASATTTEGEGSTFIPSPTIAASTTTPESSASASSSDSLSSSLPSASQGQGLSTGVKAGIGVGVAIAVIILVLLSFFLGQRYSRRRNITANKTYDDFNSPGGEDKDVFQAGRPYEHTKSQHSSRGESTGKDHTYSEMATEVDSEFSGASHEAMDAYSPTHQAEAREISALPQVREDEPMYVGVPSHMSGSKRWSMKEYER